MERFKSISLRLPVELLDRVDEHAEAVGGDSNRSFVLRSLIEAGLEKSRLEAQIAELQTSISRLMLVVEKAYVVGYLSTRILHDTQKFDGIDGFESKEQYRKKVNDEANRMLVNALVEKFGY
ncbi:ribbon-helix-helix domain-containing protein [Burkholderia multivorans]|uniref:ribbon-helix-helix domain-containing protein n=1 Tax=Burkholderia multivorans TaxID=87883 RepID=UPI00158A4954|nr:ribbon-helix-helix domain-containing protein [Burkholderia multivorans]